MKQVRQKYTAISILVHIAIFAKNDEKQVTIVRDAVKKQLVIREFETFPVACCIARKSFADRLCIANIETTNIYRRHTAHNMAINMMN